MDWARFFHLNLWRFAWVLLASSFLSVGNADAATATRVRLLLPATQVAPGETILAGLELSHREGWHTYWRHGGDSGKPTEVAWKLPAGITAGDIRWPTPERHEDDGFVTYVYHGTVVLLVPISIGRDVPPGKADILADVKWLECESQCVPGKGTIRGSLDIGTPHQASADAPILSAAELRLPVAATLENSVAATWDGPAVNDERPLLLRVGALPPTPGTVPDFFPLASDHWEIGTATERPPSTTPALLLRKKVKSLDGTWPVRLEGVLVQLTSGKVPAGRGISVDVAISANSTTPPARNAEPAPTPAARPAGALNPATSETAPIAATIAPLSLGGAVALGLLGGLILNIMPCVLPVIALKILGFVRQGGNRPTEVRRLGLIYGLGVWVSFMILATVVILVKRAVGVASWGMQFGNPVFLVALTTLITLVSLSLFGLFEINVTGRALDAAGELTTKEGATGAFFNGMLAVALATPCTAPALAPALGYAFAASAGTILLVFSAVAVGLAAPYVALSFQPAALKLLPKPGAWMERFKIAMGFPMLATAIWLYSLSTPHFGDAGPLWLGLFLVGIALAAWVWGEFVQRGRTRTGLAMAVTAIIAITSYIVALERELKWRSPSASATTESSRSLARQNGIPWAEWSPAAVAAARQQKKPVLVDFTADWCLTCKLNERSSIEIPEVRAKLTEIGAVALKGDHTRLPAAITAELQRYRRAGVPLVLVYPRDASKEAIVLPEVLTPGIMLSALEAAGK